MNYISDTLYWISTGLLVPVITLLIILFIRALILVGSFFGQYLNIKKTSSVIKQELRNTNKENVDSLISRISASSNSKVANCIKQVIENKDNKPQIKRIISNYEIEADKDISISKTLAKLGPILGLMGTLIPMGPALAGLASGDISSMAYNMQIAFATTVVGLLAGAIGFLTQQVKQRWYLQDLIDLEYVAELLSDEQK